MMHEKKYLIEPVQLKRMKAQLQYRLHLQKNIEELQKKKKKNSIFSRLKELF